MKTNYHLTGVTFLIVLIMLFSACGQKEQDINRTNDESSNIEKVLKVKGGPSTYEVYIDESYKWNEMSSTNKISLIDKSITTCQSMEPSQTYTIKGFYQDSEQMVFEWDSTAPSNYYEYIDGEKMKLEN